MADWDTAQQRAQAVLDEFGFNEPLVDVFKIADAKDIEIIPIIPPEDENTFSGFMENGGQQPTIYVNANEPVQRQNWTIGHELGHFLLGHEPDQWGINWRDKDSRGKNEFEQEADFFAANLLIPRHMLASTLTKYQLRPEDHILLAKIFGVSPEAMRRRLDYLEL